MKEPFPYRVTGSGIFHHLFYQVFRFLYFKWRGAIFHHSFFIGLFLCAVVPVFGYSTNNIFFLKAFNQAPPLHYLYPSDTQRMEFAYPYE
jgi:hypothetical protein